MRFYTVDKLKFFKGAATMKKNEKTKRTNRKRPHNVIDRTEDGGEEGDGTIRTIASGLPHLAVINRR